MRGTRIEITNFGSIAHEVVDLSAINLAVIVGPNGAGKSTLFLAQRIAEYGAKVDDLVSLIRTGAKSWTIDYQFEANRTEYRVVREQAKSQTAMLYRMAEEGWSPIAGPKVSDVDAKLIEVIGCTYTEATIAHHLPQGGLDAFSKLDASERKAWLMSHLPMGEWKALEDAVKNHVADVKAKLLAKRGILADAAIVEDTMSLRFELSQIETGLAMKRRALELTEQHITSARETNERYRVAEQDYLLARAADATASVAVAAAQETLSRAQAALTSLQTVIGADLPPKRDVEALVTEKATLQEQIRGAEKAKSALASAETSARDAAAKTIKTGDALRSAGDVVLAFDAVEDAICPTCGQGVSDNTRAVVRGALIVAGDKALADDNEAIESSLNARERLEDLMSSSPTLDTGAVTARLSAIERDIADARSIDSQYALRDQAEAQRPGAEVAEKNAQSALASLQDAHADARKLTEHCAAIRDDIERIDVTEAEESRRMLNAEVGSALAEIRGIETRIEASEAAVTKYEALKAEVAALESEQTTLELLAKAYGKNGIPARIIEGALREIEEHANEFLSHFTNGLDVSFVTQKDNRTGGTIKETLDIYVTYALGTRPIKRSSGGEKVRVNIALAVGMGKFLEAHGGGHMDSFSIDEIDALDAAGEEELITSLHVLSRTISNVMLVTHADRLKDAMPQRLTVTPGASGSTIEVSA